MTAERRNRSDVCQQESSNERVAAREEESEAGSHGPDGIGFLLGVAHRARRRRWESELADLGLTAPQAAVLRVVAAQPGMGVRNIARRLGTDPMNAQRIAEGLISSGLCLAGRDPLDSRRRPLSVTTKGARVAAEVSSRARRSEFLIAEILGSDAYKGLMEALRSLIRLEESDS